MGDRSIMSELKEWFAVVRDYNRKIIHLTGDVHNHERFDDGKYVTTSCIKSVDKLSDNSGYVVKTRNTTYLIRASECINPKWSFEILDKFMEGTYE